MWEKLLDDLFQRVVGRDDLFERAAALRCDGRALVLDTAESFAVRDDGREPIFELGDLRPDVRGCVGLFREQHELADRKAQRRLAIAERLAQRSGFVLERVLRSLDSSKRLLAIAQLRDAGNEPRIIAAAIDESFGDVA